MLGWYSSVLFNLLRTLRRFTQIFWFTGFGQNPDPPGTWSENYFIYSQTVWVRSLWDPRGDWEGVWGEQGGGGTRRSCPCRGGAHRPLRATRERSAKENAPILTGRLEQLGDKNHVVLHHFFLFHTEESIARRRCSHGFLRETHDRPPAGDPRSAR